MNVTATWLASRRIHPGWLPGGALLLLVVAWGGWQLYRLINPAVAVEVASDCDLQAGPCELGLGVGRVRLELSPRPLKPLKALQVQAKFEGLEPLSVALDLSGRDMYMGYNRPELRADGSGGYQGQLVIPVCSSQVMNWQARLFVETSDGLVSAPFNFQTDASR